MSETPSVSSMPLNSARALLSCRHDIMYCGPFDYSWLDVLIPRRKDGSFGAIKCERCRRKRRVVSAQWTLTRASNLCDEPKAQR